jgi:hypothetical protein
MIERRREVKRSSTAKRRFSRKFVSVELAFSTERNSKTRASARAYGFAWAKLEEGAGKGISTTRKRSAKKRCESGLKFSEETTALRTHFV